MADNRKTVAEVYNTHARTHSDRKKQSKAKKFIYTRRHILTEEHRQGDQQ